MKTSSENLFIDTLKDLGLNQELCEAVNDMRKAVMEAEEGATKSAVSYEDIPVGNADSEQDLIEKNLIELHEKLAEKLKELQGNAAKYEEIIQKFENGSNNELANEELEKARYERAKEELEKVNYGIEVIGDYYWGCLGSLNKDGTESLYSANLPGGSRGERSSKTAKTATTNDEAIREISKCNEKGKYDYHWPLFYSGEDANNLIKLQIKYDGKAPNDVMELLDQTIDAYDKIWEGMKKQHVVRVEYRNRSPLINLENLAYWVPRTNDKKFIDDVITSMNSTNKKPERRVLKEIFSIYEKCMEELPKLKKIYDLQNTLKYMFPSTYEKYNELVTSYNGDIKDIHRKTFKKLINELEENQDESLNILENILDTVSELEGGIKTQEYIQWRDNLDTAAEKGSTVERGSVPVLDEILMKETKTYNPKYRKFGEDDKKKTKSIGDTGLLRREGKDWYKVRRVTWKDRADEEIKDMDKNLRSISGDISNSMDFIVDITKNETDTRKTAEKLKKYVLKNDTDDKVMNEYLSEIVSGIKNGDVKDDTIIDRNLSRAYNTILHTQTGLGNDVDPLFKNHVEMEIDGLKDVLNGEQYRRSGIDIDVLNMTIKSMNDILGLTDDALGLLHKININLGKESEKFKREREEAKKQYKEAVKHIYDVSSNCADDIDDIINAWTGETRCDDISKIVKDVFDNSIKKKISKRTDAVNDMIGLRNRKSTRERIEENILNAQENENGIIKSIYINDTIEYRIPTDDGKEGTLVAKRFDQVFDDDDTNYGAVEFEYDGKNYGIWTARDFRKQVGTDITTGKYDNKFYVGKVVPVVGEGSGYMYSYNTADKLVPKGWHIPTVYEWRDLITEYLGNVIENSSAKNIVDRNAGAFILKSKSMNGLDCFDFGIYPGGTRDPIGGYQSQDTIKSVYYWCGDTGGKECIRFDYFSDSASIIPVSPAYMACLRLVKNS